MVFRCCLCDVDIVARHICYHKSSSPTSPNVSQDMLNGRQQEQQPQKTPSRHNNVSLRLFLSLSSGTFDIFMGVEGIDKLVGCYDNQGSFGELALMYNTPRAATIVATSPGALWCLVSEYTSRCV